MKLPAPTISGDSLIGRTIVEKYTLRSLLGVGASGTVYAAEQLCLGRTVAIKILRPELAENPRFVSRFTIEALAASRLNHPHVVSMIDYGQTEDGLLFLVMEYLRGQTLSAFHRGNTLPADTIRHVMAQIGSALEEAHSVGVIHADMKTENVVVDFRREQVIAKVVDFGISRLVGNPQDQDSEQVVCGTPEYMAPEVISGNAPTPQSDIYAKKLHRAEYHGSIDTITDNNFGSAFTFSYSFKQNVHKDKDHTKPTIDCTQ